MGLLAHWDHCLDLGGLAIDHLDQAQLTIDHEETHAVGVKNESVHAISHVDDLAGFAV